MTQTIKKLNKNTLAALVAAATVMVSVQSQAEEGMFYFNPAVGYYGVDSKRVLDNETIYTLGGEYRYNNNWATELRFSQSEPSVKDVSAETEVTLFNIDMIRYFAEAQAKVQPFGVFGLGHAEFDGDQHSSYKYSDSTETQLNTGLGLRYVFNDLLSLRGDARAIYGVDDDTWESAINLGLSFAFGSIGKKVVEEPVEVNVDSDNDGVLDVNDRCPGTPAGVSVDANGCPLDSDNDGVADYLDECPDTLAGVTVDSRGCIIKKDVVRDHSIDLRVNYATNSAVITAAEKARAFDQINDFVKRYNLNQVIVEGHTDSRGAESYNQALSERRANSVRDVLISEFGIDASKITAVGYGEARPIGDNNTKEGRYENRRSTVVFKATTTENN